jgi:hypothetical protein
MCSPLLLLLPLVSVENYETEGVLFQGNIRGKDPALIYSRMRERLRQEFGEQYELFLLQVHKGGLGWVG